MKTVIGFYCGGAGCHNEGQPPNYFPDNDATLYRTLTEYKVAKCGGRVLVKPCAPEESAFYRAQTEPPMCDLLPQDALRLRSRELYVARGSRGHSPVDRQGRPYGLRRFAGCRAATRAAIRGCFARHASTSFAAQRG